MARGLKGSAARPTSEYVYGRNHPQHLALASACADEVSAAYPDWVGRIRSQALRNLFAFIVALGKPSRDVLLLEAPGCLIPMLPRLRKRTRVLMIHSDQTLHALENAPAWKRWIARRILGRVDVFVSSSPMMRATAQRLFPRSRHAIFRLFVEADRWPSSYDPHAGLCLYVGRADRFKNQGALLDAVEDLRARKAWDLRVKIIGNVMPDYASILRSEERPWVEITGWLPDPVAALRPAAHYVNAALWEPAGINILEAMAMGIPPIVSDRCGYAYLVERVAPRLVCAPNAKAIADALEWLEARPEEERRELGARARATAEAWTRKRAERRFKRIWQAYAGPSASKRVGP